MIHRDSEPIPMHIVSINSPNYPANLFENVITVIQSLLIFRWEDMSPKYSSRYSYFSQIWRENNSSPCSDLLRPSNVYFLYQKTPTSLPVPLCHWMPLGLRQLYSHAYIQFILECPLPAPSPLPWTRQSVWKWSNDVYMELINE